MKAKIIKKSFLIKKKKLQLSVKAFDVNHGLIKSTGYLIYTLVIQTLI